MSNASSRATQGFGLIRLHFHHFHRRRSCNSGAALFNSTSPSQIPTTNHPPTFTFRSNFTSHSNHIHALNKHRPKSSASTHSLGLGRKHLSLLKTPNLGYNAKGLIEKPATDITATFSRYREATGLQVDAFLKRNGLFLLGAGGVVACTLLWRIMFGIASAFVTLSEGMAKYGSLALSSAIVAFSGLYIRSRFTINPDRVYRMAMRRLNTSAGILEVMGAPLTGKI